ncbi:DODA-type extradiol aromatic ring-opening family dioxygenase [Brevibacillus sp. B_LB10_24]|uniref:DODA-type extradiol aromatic ring-opening family dioxygenase n=1 Tax=Brevibacillus sp. B_LB10_24 TaxID=3380645 RepID=UPI0038B7ADC0
MVPSLFIAHGAPLLALEDNGYTRFLEGMAKDLPRPQAIVIFSAHWEHPVQQVGGAKQYEMIYDFYGFPDELYRINYPASGDVKLAEEVRSLLQAQGISSELDPVRGLDHGAWVVLRLLYPAADIPVIAMSVNPGLAPREQYAVGKALAGLRERGVLIIGSGGTVHNLRRIDWASTQPAAWAAAFDDWLSQRLLAWDTEALFDYEQQAPHAKEAVPRNEHFIPILIAMGAADNSRTARMLHRSYEYGSLSYMCCQFG